MRLPEQRLWTKLRDNLVTRHVLLERVENLVNVGTPDVHAIANGQTTWLELKATEMPARSETPLLGRDTVSRDQRNWHMNYHQHGGRSLIVIGVGPRVTLSLSGEYVDKVNEMPFHEIMAKAVAVNWEELEWYLSTPSK